MSSFCVCTMVFVDVIGQSSTSFSTACFNEPPASATRRCFSGSAVSCERSVSGWLHLNDFATLTRLSFSKKLFLAYSEREGYNCKSTHALSSRFTVFILCLTQERLSSCSLCLCMKPASTTTSLAFETLALFCLVLLFVNHNSCTFALLFLLFIWGCQQ